MKPRRLIVLIVCATLLALLGYHMVQSVHTDPNVVFIYLYVFVVIAVIVSATRISGSRRYILNHPRTVKIAGLIVGGIGGLLLVGFIVAAAKNGPENASELEIWAALAPIVLGFMIYRLPQIATPRKEITDLFEWMNK